jgi:lysine/ornithine N-monooxygenase
MQIIVVGAGQLAAEILGAMRHGSDWHVTLWLTKQAILNVPSLYMLVQGENCQMS